MGESNTPLYQEDQGMVIRGLCVGILRPAFSKTSIEFAEAVTDAQQYSRFNKPFILPSMDRGPIIVVPSSQIKTIYSYSESKVDAQGAQDQTIQSRWTIWHSDVANTNPLLIKVIRYQLTRNLDCLTPDIVNEIEYRFKRLWGESEDWRTIALYESCMGVISGAGNRAFCGTELCEFPLLCVESLELTS